MEKKLSYVFLITFLVTGWMLFSKPVKEAILLCLNPPKTASEYVQAYKLEKFLGISKDTDASEKVAISGTVRAYNAQEQAVVIEFSIPEYLEAVVKKAGKLDKPMIAKSVKVKMTKETVLNDPYSGERNYSSSFRGDERPILSFLNAYVSVVAKVEEGELVMEKMHIAVIGRGG